MKPITGNEPEREVESYLRKGVKYAGGISYKWVSPGQSGVPDRIVFWPHSQVDLVELKTTTGKLSPIQKLQIGRIEDVTGMKVHVLYGMEDVKKYLEERVRR